MQAVLLEEFQEPLTVQEVERPEPEPDGAVAEVIGCGICRSDWHCWQGDWDWFGYRPDPPHVLGHEPTGRIVSVGEDVENIEEGQEVAIPFNFACGTCDLCRNGRENICENHIGLGFMNQAPGAFAEEVHIPNADLNAVPLPDGIDAESAAGMGCRFMTSFHAMAHRAPVSAGDDVVIHGCGGIGLSAVHIANALGGNVIGVDLMDEKLERAEDLGAVATVNAQAVDDPAKEVRDITDGGADVSADALGIATTCQNAVNSLRKGGTHVQIGLTTSEEAGMVSLPTDEFVAKEIDFKGSLGLQPSRYSEMLDMVESSKLDPTALVEDTVDIHQVPDELAAMSDYNTVGIPVCNEFSN
ncbi:zinc-dependent alcohol dehydrogenase family protein [Haloarcula hispanica]|uniref:Alcohol dehydrogenase n=1 Tax=Haloarcula hispanica TaxID=51589 RepID=A0A482T1I7_HALHI|nr:MULTISPECIES: zinc-dependent alcohol dehydrogenase family protein [Haloarcula]KAA9407684.1 alcohol dehydrogenase [Haloarcula sp. CBA1131]MCJ0618322.1 zinc-dependent alcohol dehydrogenase family protein [Haloarcula hispanica]RYJ08926.1 alcohol dehydrogenase [Haloarcula hispanica]